MTTTTLAATQPTQASSQTSVETSDVFELAEVQVSVVMPCLNEARTVGDCIEQAQAALDSRQYRGEIIIADNGSADGSQAIAAAAGARVVSIPERGYGSALRGGIAAARGMYIVMGDSDCSYDFGEIPRFVDKLREGYDLVMGNRFAGAIKPGAMPWHHRYFGNPVLSGLGRLLYRTPCRDWHCGLRAFRREAVQRLDIQSAGMEFASELIAKASIAKLQICEIPITLYPDERGRAPHLRSVRDGLRHLALLVRLSLTGPKWGTPSVSRSSISKPTKPPSYQLVLTIVLVLLCAVSYAGYRTGSMSGGLRYLAGQRILVTPDSIVLDAEDNSLQAFEIINLTNRTLEIVGAGTSCSCIEIEGLPATVNSGSRHKLIAQFVPARKNNVPMQSVHLYLDDPHNPKLTVNLAVPIQP